MLCCVVLCCVVLCCVVLCCVVFFCVVLCCADATSSFEIMLLNTTKENMAAQMTPFAHFKFCNRYILKISKHYLKY